MNGMEQYQQLLDGVSEVPFTFLRESENTTEGTRAEIAQEGFSQLISPKQGDIAFELGLYNATQREDIRNTLELYRAKMNQKEAKDCPGAKLHVHTTDKKSFRIYISTNTWLSSNYYQNRFASFVRSLKEDQTCTIVLGATVGGWWDTTALGSMIAALQACEGSTVTYATGKCSFPETVLWLYGKERKISPYGGLLFTGVGEYIKHCPYYSPFFENIYERGITCGVLTEEQKEKLLESTDIISYRAVEEKEASEG